MHADEATETLRQLRSYTTEVSKFLGIKPHQSGSNSNGPFKEGQPTGAITHYTASNMSITRSRPYGRIPVLLNRFAPGATQGVGVHFIVWDQKVNRFEDMRKRYPLLDDMPGECFFMGHEEAFWHAGWFNNLSYGIEVRNLGRLIRSKNGRFFWRAGIKYIGRKPIRIGKSWWEPYTWQQMAATLWIHRLMCKLYPIRPERFLGHVHIASNRIDPGKHFPIHEMRMYALDEPDIPINEIPFLREFVDDPDIYDREDIPPESVITSEESLHADLYRHDWDGRPWELQEESFEFNKTPALITDASEAAKAWKDLRSLGYYPGEKPDSKEFRETIKIFQSRWKVRRKRGRGWKQELKSTGDLDEKTLNKLSQMVKMIDVM